MLADELDVPLDSVDMVMGDTTSVLTWNVRIHEHPALGSFKSGCGGKGNFNRWPQSVFI
jgi:hypothetical protein